jgi:hypothetical protein
MINSVRDEEREAKQTLKDSDWDFLMFKGQHVPIHMRCPDRQHAVTLTPAQALTEGCPICKLMDAPPTTVTVSRLKRGVEKQDKEELKSLNKSRRAIARRSGNGYGLEQYWMGK